jgi:hypothetical protein
MNGKIHYRQESAQPINRALVLCQSPFEQATHVAPCMASGDEQGRAGMGPRSTGNPGGRAPFGGCPAEPDYYDCLSEFIC